MALWKAYEHLENDGHTLNNDLSILIPTSPEKNTFVRILKGILPLVLTRLYILKKYLRYMCPQTIHICKRIICLALRIFYHTLHDK